MYAEIMVQSGTLATEHFRNCKTSVRQASEATQTAIRKRLVPDFFSTFAQTRSPQILYITLFSSSWPNPIPPPQLTRSLYVSVAFV